MPEPRHRVVVDVATLDFVGEQVRAVFRRRRTDREARVLELRYGRRDGRRRTWREVERTYVITRGPLGLHVRTIETKQRVHRASRLA